MSERKWTDPCKCTFHQKMAGDGCDLCNPDRAKELKEEDGVMSGRREGWYWVKAPNPYGPSTWLPCHHFDGTWSFGEECIYPEQIGPRIPTPDEPWVCVPKKPTEEMLAKAHQEIDWVRPNQNTHLNDHPSQKEDGCTSCKEDMQDAYRQLLSAAPKPEDKQ